MYDADWAPAKTDGAEVADVAGRVWMLSQTADGSRQVQRALEDAPSDQARADLAMELVGNVWKALKCQHANYVLQKCIMTLRPKALQFILDEIMSKPELICWAAQHKVGCRTIQRLLEHCTLEQTCRFVDKIIEDSLEMSCHAYGYYVMQQIIEHAAREQQDRVAKILELNARDLGLDRYAGAVLSKALNSLDDDWQTRLARVLVGEKELIAKMACSRHGHGAVKAVFEILTDEEREEAIDQLMKDVHILRGNRYGRNVLSGLDDETMKKALDGSLPC
jgi:pumilio RNA-binding family